MSTFVMVILIVGGTLLVIAVILGIVFSQLRRVGKARGEAARQRFPNARAIVAGANFFGQQSHGVTQLRGNGTLVITDSEVYFEMWLPRRELTIPLSAVQGSETVRGFLGKTVGRPLLKINFLNN